MNERETKVGRRNQVLFSLGKISSKSFNTADVEAILRKEFPQTTSDVRLGVGQILSDLASREEAVIKRSSHSNAYEFRDARCAMALRVLLQKDFARQKVSKAGYLST